MGRGLARIQACGLAAAPAGAPIAVADNRLVALPYHHGGGHVSFADHADDCSGGDSYALPAAGPPTAPYVPPPVLRVRHAPAWCG